MENPERDSSMTDGSLFDRRCYLLVTMRVEYFDKLGQNPLASQIVRCIQGFFSRGRIQRLFQLIEKSLNATRHVHVSQGTRSLLHLPSFMC